MWQDRPFAKFSTSTKVHHKLNGVRPQQRKGPDKSQLKQQGNVVRKVHHTQQTSEEDHHIWSLYRNQMEVNSINKPLVTVMINNPALKVLVTTGSSINLLDEETFKSVQKHPMLTEVPNPVIPMNIRGIFSAEISGNNATVSSTLYVTCEGKDNLIRVETDVLLGNVPKIFEVNKVRELISKKTTNSYSRLFEE